MMFIGLQRQRYGEMICDKLREKFFFDEHFPANKENRLKIVSVFEYFIKNHTLDLCPLEFPENSRASDSLKDIHDLYQINLCEENGVSRDDHTEFCKLIDECIGNKIEDFKKIKKGNLNKNKKRNNECLKDSYNLNTTNFMTEKLKEAENKRQKNLMPKQTFDEKFLDKAKEYYLCESRLEEQRRGFTEDWLEIYPFSSQEEVQFILDHWTRVFTLTKFIDRLSFKDLMLLEPEDRKIFIQNSNNIDLLFEHDKEITCTKIMNSSIATRNLLIVEAKYVISLLDTLKKYYLEIVNFEDNDEENRELNFLGEQEIEEQDIEEQDIEEQEINAGKVENEATDGEEIETPLKPFTLEDLLKCSYEQLALILHSSDRLTSLLYFRRVPFDRLIAYNNPQSLFQSPCDQETSNFLEQFSTPQELFWAKGDEVLNKEEKQKICEYWFEFQMILNFTAFDVTGLFEHLKTEDLDSLIQNIDKISSLLHTTADVNVDHLPTFIKRVYGAIDIVDYLKEEQVNQIETFSEDSRHYILENSQAFRNLLLTTDWELEVLKDMSLKVIKNLIDEQALLLI